MISMISDHVYCEANISCRQFTKKVRGIKGDGVI